MVDGCCAGKSYVNDLWGATLCRNQLENQTKRPHDIQEVCGRERVVCNYMNYMVIASSKCHEGAAYDSGFDFSFSKSWSCAYSLTCINDVEYEVRLIDSDIFFPNVYYQVVKRETSKEESPFNAFYKAVNVVLGIAK